MVPDSCSVDSCDRPRHARQLCCTHYYRLRKFGSVDLPARAKPPAEFVTARGYVMVSDSAHPNANSSGNVFKHRAVMSEHLGRPLAPHESVHHVNGDRTDNRLENLELWSKSQPAGQRVEDKVSWAMDILRTYAPHTLA